MDHAPFEKKFGERKGGLGGKDLYIHQKLKQSKNERRVGITHVE